MQRALATLAVLAVLASACTDPVTKLGEDGPDPTTSPSASAAAGATDPPTATSSPSDGSTTAPRPAFEEDEPGVGRSRDRALRVGSATPIEDWTIRVVAYDPDATDEVLEFNAANQPPPDGQVFAVARIEATWNGEGNANAFLELEWALVADDGTEFTDEDCGVLPDDLASQSNVPPGETGSGTICFSTDEDRLGEVVLFIAPLLGEPNTRRWWTAPAEGAGTVFQS